jgi:hypothetical protein
MRLAALAAVTLQQQIGALARGEQLPGLEPTAASSASQPCVQRSSLGG